jgi:hypothetical protein
MKKLNHNFRNLLLGVVILAFLIFAGVSFSAWKDRQITKEITKRVAAEEKIKSLARDHTENKKAIDSMLTDRAKLIAVIEYQKNNPNIIIQKYETIHHNIDQLAPADNYKLFTANLIKYKRNKERYSLQRFKR